MGKLEKNAIRQKGSKRHLLTSGDDWRSLVDNALNLIFIVDRESTIHYTNQTVIGLELEKVVGKSEASPPSRAGVLPCGSASQPGKEIRHFEIAPLDPALPDGGSALRRHFVSGEHAGHYNYAAPKRRKTMKKAVRHVLETGTTTSRSPSVFQVLCFNPKRNPSGIAHERR